MGALSGVADADNVLAFYALPAEHWPRLLDQSAGALHRAIGWHTDVVGAFSS